MKLISFSTLRSMCLDLVIFLIPSGIFFFALPFILKIFLPFIVGFFLYLAARPINRRMRKRLGASFCAFFSLFFISVCVFLVFRMALLKITDEISSFMESPPSAYTDTLINMTQKIRVIIDENPVKALSVPDNVVSDIYGAFLNSLTGLLSSVSSFLVNAAKNLPSRFIAAFASVFTAFFLLKDDVRFFEFFRRFFGEKAYSFFSDVKNSFLSATASYLKAQLIIGAIIFSVLFLGFLILKVRYSFILAILTALVDVVPVFGTGTVLVPMAIFYFLTGSKALGWGLLALYGTSLLIRQLCEPKIVGNSLGIHPLASVFSIYAGMKLFGIWGLIFGPLAAIFIKNLIFHEQNPNVCSL